MPFDAAVALVSLRLPPVGPVTVSDSTCTRMPSYLSSWSMPPAGLVSEGLSTTGGGSGLPTLIAKTLLGEAISVCDGLAGSLPGTNSWTFPVTHNSLPATTTAGGADEVNTNTPSEVAGSPSPGGGIWMKKPLDFRPVTMPLVVTPVAPASGDVSPLPWISAMVWVGVHVGTGWTASWNCCCATFEPLSATLMVNVNGEPVMALGEPLRVASVRLRPGGSAPLI